MISRLSLPLRLNANANRIQPLTSSLLLSINITKNHPFSSSNQPTRLSDQTYDAIRIFPKPTRSSLSSSSSSPSCTEDSAIGIRDLLTPKTSKSTTLSSSKTSNSIHVRDLLALSLIPRSQLHSHSSSSSSSPLSSTDIFQKDSSILPRGSAILIKMAHIKAIVWKDSALLFDPHRPEIRMLANSINRSLLSNAQNSTCSFGEIDVQYPHPSDQRLQPFELIFLERLLQEICSTYTRRVSLYRPVVNGLLSSITLELETDTGMHRLMPLKDSLQSFELEVNNAIACLSGLLANDEDMLSLLLTSKSQAKLTNQLLDLELHSQVELLLEDYNRQLLSVLQESKSLQKRVQTKQDLIAISLSAYRTRLIQMNVHLSIAAVSLSTCTTIAGYFGMNLFSGMESTPGIFPVVVIGSFGVAVGLYAVCHNYLNNNKRAMDRAEEVKAVSGVLSEMGSLDYALKRAILKKDEYDVNKESEIDCMRQKMVRIKKDDDASEEEEGGNQMDGNLGRPATREDKRLISREQFKKWMEIGRNGGAEFNGQWDSDGGRVGRKMKKVSEAELELIFEILDKTGDGFLDREEMIDRGRGKGDEKKDGRK